MNRRDIVTLTPNIGVRWVIKGRVTVKSDRRHRNDGDLFSFTIEDQSGEIEITAYREECNKWFNFIRRDGVYYVARGIVRVRNAGYECHLQSSSLIEKCIGERIGLPVIVHHWNDNHFREPELRTLIVCSDINLVRDQRDQILYSTVIAGIQEVHQNPEPVYRCCPINYCFKKVRPDETGGWICEKCQRVYQHHGYRYKVKVTLKDETEMDAILWGDEAKRLFGEEPHDLFLKSQNICEMNNYESILSNFIDRRFKFTLKTKLSSINRNRLEHKVLSHEAIPV